MTAAAPHEANAPALRELLQRVFGHESFRSHQEEVCQALERGENALLVMPTGAGKSLCYQLPGLARRGTTLVISPLIALMDDQVSQLTQLGLRASAIHSGKPREHSRAACIDYLNDALDFLFIAPERLALQRFADFLARKTPALIAIDEAHCISHWGHDFRPDYRLLQKRLPHLMPAPVVALTATATARVQDDIIAQLGVHAVRRFVFGFRRDNLAIEVSEVTPAQRPQLVAQLLAPAGRRPAIIYAPTRKEAEKQAEALSEMGARAYHAGMDNDARDRVSRAFLDGKIDVVVATVAFGMGIDKANVRTVVHTALPSSVEGYYQEIGRAGRDGQPSRAILLHSFADLRTHEWFMDRDYPPVSELQEVFDALGRNLEHKDALLAKTGLDEDRLDRVLEKLLAHGGAERAGYDEFTRGDSKWRSDYETQVAHKRAQLAAMRGFTDGHACRMLKLISHFGDQEDNKQPCGLCDVCAPAAALSVVAHTPSAGELKAARAVLDLLKTYDDQSTGKLFREAGSTLDRKQFDALLAAMRRADYLDLYEDEFEKDGRTIRFYRAKLTSQGYSVQLSDLEQMRLTQSPSRPSARTSSSRSAGRAKAGKRKGERTPLEEIVLDSNGERLAAALKEWRRAQASANGAPPYTVLTDRAIAGIASRRPNSLPDLLQVHGVGPGVLDKYGRAVLDLVASHD